MARLRLIEVPGRAGPPATPMYCVVCSVLCGHAILAHLTDQEYNRLELATDGRYVCLPRSSTQSPLHPFRQLTIRSPGACLGIMAHARISIISSCVCDATTSRATQDLSARLVTSDAPALQPQISDRFHERQNDNRRLYLARNGQHCAASNSFTEIRLLYVLKRIER